VAIRAAQSDLVKVDERNVFYSRPREEVRAVGPNAAQTDHYNGRLGDFNQPGIAKIKLIA